MECGVNKGFLSSSIMRRLDWDRLGSSSISSTRSAASTSGYLSEDDVREGVVKKNDDLIASGFYATEAESVRRNFSEWRNVQIIEGTIPETLPQVRAERIAYLHLD